MDTTLIIGLPARVAAACRDAGYSVSAFPDGDAAAAFSGVANAIVASADAPGLAVYVGRVGDEVPLLLLGAVDDVALERRATKLLPSPAEPVLLLFELRQALSRRSIAESTVQQKMRALWEQYRGLNLERIANLERLVIQLVSSRDEALLTEARRDAHKLAGVLGSFGFERASDEAILLQGALDAALAGADLDVNAAAQRVIAIRADLDGDATPTEARGEGELVLIVERDGSRAAALVRAISAAGLRALHCDSFGSAGAALHMQRPKAVVIDLAGLVPAAPYVAQGSDERLDDALLLVSEVSEAAPFVAIVVMSPSLELTRRVQAARGGAALFLDDREPAPRVAEQVRRLIDFATRRVRVLALDDDREILELLREVLPSDLIDLATAFDADALWRQLESSIPDVLLLDVEMPKVNGIELCRALRADPRFASLPILVLTSARSAKTVSEVFAAGADDFLTKPVIATEIVSRIMNRLRRVELLRAGAGDRDRGHVMRSVALVRTDAPSQQLRLPGATLGRWSDDVMILVSSEHAPGLESELSARREADGALAGATIAVAELSPRSQLVDVARRLEAMLHGGAGTVQRLTEATASNDVDVIVVEDEETVASLLLFTLQSRGYTTHWIRDGLEAAEHLSSLKSPVPRIVLLDIDLPSLDGLSVLRRLAQGGHLARMRVLIVSVRAAESEIVAALESGAFDHIAKPFSLAVLSEKVRKALES